MSGAFRRSGRLALQRLSVITGPSVSASPVHQGFLEASCASLSPSRTPSFDSVCWRAGFASTANAEAFTSTSSDSIGHSRDSSSPELGTPEHDGSSDLEIPGPSQDASEFAALADPAVPSSAGPGPGVDPSEIMSAVSHAESDALLTAWHDSGWNIFNSGFQALLTGVHDTTGMPWWVTIIVMAVAARAALLPVALAQVRNTYKMTRARPDMLELKEWYNSETARNNPQAKLQYQMRMAQLWKKHDCNPLKSMGSIFMQVPLFIGFFGALRSFAAAKVPSLTHGGALWFSDLTIADPTYALPVLCSAMLLITVEVGAADGMQGQDPSLLRNMKNVMRVVSVILVPVTAAMPQGVFLYWITSNTWSLAQASVFKIASVRETLRLPPLNSMPATTATGLPLPGKPVETFVHRPAKTARKVGKA